MADSRVVTRFAPSPTGNLHVGGARTALYAWAYARRHGGQFLLRLEDTDRARSSEAAAQGIIRDLRWLGLEWDNPSGGEDIPRQSERLDRYHAVVQQLLDAGKAYEQDGAVRFRGGFAVAFDDAVYGHVAVPAGDFEDFVIRKGEAGDYFPTFHLAVVVDDADFGTTHVIRGVEHLSNTAKHAALCDALGFDRPVWAHTPSIMNPDGSKMSKRDKAKAARAAAKDADLKTLDGVDADTFTAFLEKQSDSMDVASAIASAMQLSLPEIDVADFRNSGYLPAPLCNYLALLGWNPGGDEERFDMAFLIEHFGLDRINKGNAKFDRAKLLDFNRDHIAKLPVERYRSALLDLRSTGDGSIEWFRELSRDAQIWFAQATHERARTLREPFEANRFLFDDAAVTGYDAKAVKKNLTKNDGEGLAVLRDFRERLAEQADWSPEALHGLIETYVAQKSLKNMGSVAQPLRVALSGAAVTPPIDLTLALMGQAAALARIERCLAAHG